MRLVLPKEEIIGSSRGVQEIFRRGKRFVGQHVLFYYVREVGNGEIKAGFIVSRKIRLAVRRNRLKRLMREAYRLHVGDVRDKVKHEKHVLRFVALTRESVIPLRLKLKEVEKDFEAFFEKIKSELVS